MYKMLRLPKNKLRFDDLRHISSKFSPPAGPRALERAPGPPADLLVRYAHSLATLRVAKGGKKFPPRFSGSSFAPAGWGQAGPDYEVGGPGTFSVFGRFSAENVNFRQPLPPEAKMLTNFTFDGTHF